MRQSVTSPQRSHTPHRRISAGRRSATLYPPSPSTTPHTHPPLPPPLHPLPPLIQLRALAAMAPSRACAHSSRTLTSMRFAGTPQDSSQQALPGAGAESHRRHVRLPARSYDESVRSVIDAVPLCGRVKNAISHPATIRGDRALHVTSDTRRAPRGHPRRRAPTRLRREPCDSCAQPAASVAHRAGADNATQRLPERIPIALRFHRRPCGWTSARRLATSAYQPRAADSPSLAAGRPHASRKSARHARARPDRSQRRRWGTSVLVDLGGHGGANRRPPPRRRPRCSRRVRTPGAGGRAMSRCPTSYRSARLGGRHHMRRRRRHLAYLDALLAMPYEPFEVIVVDNRPASSRVRAALNERSATTDACASSMSRVPVWPRHGTRACERPRRDRRGDRRRCRRRS